MSNTSSAQAKNTDRELWREREGDYYADSIHVTEGGGIGIDCGGTVIVMSLRDWHLAGDRSAWNPIETAPKIGNGGPLLLLFSKTNGVYVGTWKGAFGWVTVPGSYGRHPTHWMPLPNIPER